MTDRPRLSHAGELVRGTLVDQPNRFRVRVRLDAERGEVTHDNRDGLPDRLAIG